MSSVAGARSQELSERALEVIPGGISSARRRTSPPINIARSEGAYLWDLDGRRYVDYHQAYGAILLGHCYAPVVERVAAATRELVLLGLGVTEGEVALAERLVRHIPTAEQVVLVNSGSEATYNAIRLARAVTRREKILKFQGCYHGSHDYVLRNRLSDPAVADDVEPEYGGVFRAATESVVVCRYNDVEGVDEALRANAEQVAAIIVEPIAHNPPNILPREGFLESLRELADREGVLLIFDEVITGFRHGLGGYQEICGVRPDLTTVGKALANGFPIAAVVGPRELMQRFATNPAGDVFLGGTYNGHVPGVAAALATVEVLETEPVHEHIFRLGERMRAGLRTVAAEAGIPAVVSGFGSLYTMLFMDGELVSFDDTARADAELFVRYRKELLARGVIEMPVPYVRAQVGYSHTEEDVDRTLEIASASLQAALCDS
jgi:glutamate-1-semialdehyde 2,1-aminomutase